MKRLLACILCASLLLCLTACGSGEPDLRLSLQTLSPETSQSTTAAPTEPLPAVTTSTSAATTAAAITEPTEAEPDETVPLPEQDIAILYTGSILGTLDRNIGFAGLAAYRDSLIMDDCDVLLVDLGGTLFGSSSSADSGDNVITLMKAVGYSAFLPASADLLYGTDTLEALAEKADFPFLSAGLSGRLFPTYAVIERSGVRLGLIGANETFLSGTALYTAVQKAADDAREDGADYVIALAHTQELPLLAAATRGIDVILDGSETGAAECLRLRNADGDYILASRPASGFASFGMLLISRSGNLSCGLIQETDDRDEAIDEIIAGFGEDMEAVIFTARQTLAVLNAGSERLVEIEETNFGDLVADAVRAAGGSDIALIPATAFAHGLRSGDVTLEYFLSAFAMDEPICTAEITGEQLTQILEFAYRGWPASSADFLQVSGLTMEVREDVASSVATDELGRFASLGEARKVKNVKVRGDALDPAAVYTVTAPASFFDDGIFPVSPDTQTVEVTFLTDAVRQYLDTGYAERPTAYDDPQDRVVTIPIPKPEPVTEPAAPAETTTAAASGT